MNKNKDYFNKWYYENWDKRRNYLKEKITCECGSIITRGAKFEHGKTKKHLKYKMIIPIT